MNNHIKSYMRDGVQYARTRKDVAWRKLINDPDLKAFLVGSNVAPFHFHGGWCLAGVPQTLAELAKRGNECSISTPGKRQALLARHFNAFNFYLGQELGWYPVYYVEAKGKATK